MPIDQTAIRAELEKQRAELSAELARITAVPLDPMGSVSFGKRIGEGTNEAIERINNVGVADKLQAKARDVDRAMGKLDQGTYGECDRCGLRIPAERLEAVPWATLCVDCASKRG